MGHYACDMRPEWFERDKPKLRKTLMPKKYTPWFDGGTSPVRVGVYEREYNAPKVLRTYGLSTVRNHFFIAYAYWDGNGWGMWHHTPSGALDNFVNHGVHINSPNIRWRGLRLV